MRVEVKRHIFSHSNTCIPNFIDRTPFVTHICSVLLRWIKFVFPFYPFVLIRLRLAQLCA